MAGAVAHPNAFSRVPAQSANAMAKVRLSPDEQWLQGMSAQWARNQKYAKPGPYETKLPPELETQFQAWVAQNGVPFNPNSRDPQDYDMRGYWQDIASRGGAETSVNPNDHQLHFPDTYKTPWHQSFSAESRYAQPNAPVWIDDHQLADPATGKVLYDERAR